MAKAAKAAEAAPAPAADQLAQPRARPAGKADRQWWFDARGLEDGDSGILDAAYQSGCAVIVLTPEQQDQIMTAKPRVVYVEHGEQLKKLAPDVWVLTPDEDILAKARQAGHNAGCFFAVENLEKDFARCQQLVKRGYDFVVIDMHHATYIPFELLLAEAEALPTRILRLVPIQDLHGTVDAVHQALNAFGTLENGIDVLFRSRNVREIKLLDAEIQEVLRGRMKLVEAEVVAVEHTGLGHRVCVDTTTLLTPEEGMIVGSTGWGGLFVCSETRMPVCRPGTSV